MASIAKNTALLLKPYNHIMQIRGKVLRSKIPLAFNHWLQLPQNKLTDILKIVTMLHNSSLLIDDIQDDTMLRRSLPAAHRIYGIPQTINTSVLVMSRVMEKVLQLEHPMAIKVYSEQLIEIAYGQGIDIYWRDSLICPTEDEYNEMVLQKTGGMFLLGTRLMQLFSENTNDFAKLTKLMSLYFQIRDDYCNLNNQEALEDWPEATESLGLENNNFCEDITEGKYSLPVIHALQKPEGVDLLNILKLRTRDVAVKKYFVSQLEQLGSFQYTRDVMLNLDKQVRDEIERLGGNPSMEPVLTELMSWKK